MSSQAVDLELPFPPSVNTYWRYGQLKNGARMMMISKRGRQFAKEVKELIGEAIPMTGRLVVSIHLYPPDRRRRDIDNYIKATLDALTKAGVWEDDEQVDVLFVHRGEVVKHGRASVTIKEIDKP